MQTKTDATGTTAYTYDTFGNLRNVTPPSGSAVDYVIDGMNRRVGRKVGGTVVQGLLYQNQLNAVAELDGSGSLIAQYVYGTKGAASDVRITGAGSFRIITDHLGSPHLVVDTTTGAIAERMDFDEFGNENIAPGATVAIPFGFAGGLYDASTGLVRFGARDYEASSGRWVSKDPIRFNGGQANIYVYVANDPVNLADPSGQDWWQTVLLCLESPTLCVANAANSASGVWPLGQGPRDPGNSAGGSQPGPGGGARDNGLCFYERELTDKSPDCIGKTFNKTCQYHCPLTDSEKTIVVAEDYPCPPTIALQSR